MLPDRDGFPRIGGVTVAEMGARRLIFLDRQVADDPTIDISAQMFVVLAIVERRLADSGARPSHILSVRIDLADASGYEEAMRVWTTWAGAMRVAARATVGLLEEKHGPLAEVTIVAAFTPHRPQKH